VREWIEGQPTGLERSVRAAAPKERPQARHELDERERLREVVVATRVEPADDEPLTTPAPGPTPNEVTRHVTKSGNISVTAQTFNVGRRYAGRTVTVDVGRNVLRVFYDGTLIKSLPRRNSKPIVQYEAHSRFRNTSA
jgi:hypothetical protein